MISTAIAFIGARKWMLYAFIGVVTVAMIAIAYAKVKAHGAAEERLKHLEASLKKVNSDAKLRASIERLSTDDARRRLRERWSK